MATVAITYTALPSGPIKMAITSILLTAVVIAITHPSIFYEQKVNYKGKPVWVLKNFGTAQDETLFPAWLAMTGVAYFIYIVSMSTSVMQ